MAKTIKRIFPKVDFDKLIAEKQRGLYSSTDFYRPISIAIQGNNYCSLGTCPGCGISSTNDFNKADKLPKKVILDLLKQASENGIFLFYTNFTGEITDDLDFFAEILAVNPEMDAHKLNTNCSRFNSLADAEKIFRKLKSIGWTNTKYVTPTCVLSAGMQEHKVSLENVANGIEAFGKVFAEDEAKLLISHYYTKYLYLDTFPRLQKQYQRMYGKKIKKSLLKSDPVSNFGRARNFGPDHFEMKELPKWVSDLNCFGCWHEKYICPEIYVHRDYKIYTCPLFEPHDKLLIGNAKNETLSASIKRANRDPFLRAISEGGTELIYKKLVNNFPELKKTPVSNRHEACKILGKYYREKFKY